MFHRSFLITTALLVFICCAKESVDVCGHWQGNAVTILDGEQIVQDLELDLSETGQEISGHFCWSDFEEQITSIEINGNEVLLKSEWDQGSFVLRGLVIGNTFRGRYSYKFVHDSEPYPGKFEITRDSGEGA